jgi:hypothetical protein
VQAIDLPRGGISSDDQIVRTEHLRADVGALQIDTTSMPLPGDARSFYVK